MGGKEGQKDFTGIYDDTFVRKSFMKCDGKAGKSIAFVINCDLNAFSSRKQLLV